MQYMRRYNIYMANIKGPNSKYIDEYLYHTDQFNDKWLKNLF